MVVVLVAEHVCSRAHVFEDDGSGFIGRRERERERERSRLHSALLSEPNAASAAYNGIYREEDRELLLLRKTMETVRTEQTERGQSNH